MKGRIVYEKDGRKYLLKKVPVGEITCAFCALQDWCLDEGLTDAPCMELTGQNGYCFEEINDHKAEEHENNGLGKQQQRG